jgi:hypothetical protein
MKNQYFLNIDYNGESELNFNISSNCDFNEMTISIGYSLQTTNFTVNRPILISSDLVDNEIIGSIADGYDYGTYNYTRSLKNKNAFKFSYKTLFNINQNLKLNFTNINNANPSNISGNIYILFEFFKYH